MGRKKQPHYRVVVADSQSPRDGRFVETLGYYKPLSDPARLVLDLERVDHWLGEGADPSATVRSLIAKAKAGGDSTVAIGPEDVDEARVKRAEDIAAKRAAAEKEVADKAAAEKDAAEKAAAEAAAAEVAAAEAAAAEAASAAAESVAEEAEPAATEADASDETDEDEKKAE
jgi:small subunit ribosomal protein S16